MAHDCSITQGLLRAQQTVFREAGALGISHKIIAADTGLSLSAIGQYARGETALSGPSLLKLMGVIPDSLLSLLLPDGRAIVQIPAGIDHDALCSLAEDYVATKIAAHRADSPGGEKIVQAERAVLDHKAVALRMVA